MKEQRNCPQCGRPLPSDTPQGLCPACLLKRGLESNTIGETAGEKSVRWSPPSVEELAGSFPELDILELIGRGGMGAVYKARQKELDRLVALKILPPEIGQRESFAQRFAREAQAMAKLGHPNIVTIHDFGQRGGLYFFLMEYVDGLSLRGVLNSGGVSAKEALAIVPQICDALQYAHDRGIVHRDIKPENILLNQQGQVKIADFGLAKLVGLPPAEATAAAEKVMGTPQYMAPEQVERPGEVDHRADIYSLGVVFYQMLTGELPIGRFEPPSHRVLIDVRLDEVVLRALEREPSRRYQQVSEVRTQVETIVATSPGATRVPPVVAEPAATSPRFSRLAILGLLWALLLPLGSAMSAVAASLCAGLEPDSVWRWVTGFGMVVLGLAGLFGTTILGCIAIGQIRRSAGRLYGLRLALFDALLFPLLALDGLIGWLCMSIAGLMSHSEQISREGLAAIAHTTSILDMGRDVAILICILVDGLIIWLSWRAVKKPIIPSPAPTAARAAVPDTGPAQAERARQAVKAPAIGMVVTAGINLAVLLALVAIVVMQGNIAERKVTDIAGHVVEHTVVEWTLMVPITLAGFIINGMILLGSMRMMQLRNRGLAITAAILALIAAPSNLIGLPFGIWTLVVLSRREIRTSFAARHSQAARAGLPKRRRWLRSIIALAVAIVVAVLLKTFVLAPYRAMSDAAGPEISVGSRVLVYKLSGVYQAGDIIVFHSDGKNLLGRVSQTGPSGGKLFIERRNQAPVAIAADDVVGRVVFNTRSQTAPAQPATKPTVTPLP